jgi:hypothetical protein
MVLSTLDFDTSRHASLTMKKRDAHHRNYHGAEQGNSKPFPLVLCSGPPACLPFTSWSPLACQPS